MVKRTTKAHLSQSMESIVSMNSMFYKELHDGRNCIDCAEIFIYRISPFFFFPILINLGIIVQSIKGPNLIILELINNINIVMCATEGSNSIHSNAPGKLFIQRLFSLKRHTFTNQQVVHGNFL